MHGDRVYGTAHKCIRRGSVGALRVGLLLCSLFSPIRSSILCSESQFELTTISFVPNRIGKIVAVFDRSICPSRLTVVFHLCRGEFVARGKEDKRSTERGLPLLLTGRETGPKVNIT